jgi:hypothetical protein
MIAPPARSTPGGAIGVSEYLPRLFDNRLGILGNFRLKISD